MRAAVKLHLGGDGISSLQIHDGYRLNRLNTAFARRASATPKPLSDQAAKFRIYGAGHPMIGTVLMLFFGLPSITRSLYAT